MNGACETDPGRGAFVSPTDLRMSANAEPPAPALPAHRSALYPGGARSFDYNTGSSSPPAPYRPCIHRLAPAARARSLTLRPPLVVPSAAAAAAAAVAATAASTTASPVVAGVAAGTVVVVASMSAPANLACGHRFAKNIHARTRSSQNCSVIPATRSSTLQLGCRPAPGRSRTTMPALYHQYGGARLAVELLHRPSGLGNIKGGAHPAQPAKAFTPNPLAQMRKGWRAQRRICAFGRGRRGELSFHERSSVEHEPKRLVDVAVCLIDHTTSHCFLLRQEGVEARRYLLLKRFRHTVGVAV